jgi:hypothetical protein
VRGRETVAGRHRCISHRCAHVVASRRILRGASHHRAATSLRHRAVNTYASLRHLRCKWCASCVIVRHRCRVIASRMRHLVKSRRSLYHACCAAIVRTSLHHIVPSLRHVVRYTVASSCATSLRHIGSPRRCCHIMCASCVAY